MAKVDRIAVRLDAQTKNALQAAASADGRSISSLVAKIVSEWLTKNQRPAGKRPVAKRKGEIE